MADVLGDMIVWDNHSCMPLRADASFLPQLERHRKAGATVVSLNCGFGTMSWSEHINILSFMRRWISLQPEKYRLVSSIEDILQSKSQGQLGIVFDIEGMSPVLDNLSLVQTFYELGVRWMLIAYNQNNRAGGGCQDLDCGLTSVGRQIIDEMERVGMVLCCSHTGARTADEAMDYARNPVIFSHSNPNALKAHDRNIPDHLIRSCARTGGVVHLNGIGIFLGEGNASATEMLIRHIEYIVDLVGVDHVGIGLDYVYDRKELEDMLEARRDLFPVDKGYGQCIGMLEPERISEIAEGLLKRNYTESDVMAIMGHNTLRVAKEVWR